MIYIISPYTSEDPTVMETRYQMARQFTAKGIRKGFILFSPIVHCHPLATLENLPRDVDFWLRYCQHILDLANEAIVLCIDGWDRSVGVRWENNYMLGIGRPAKKAKPVESLPFEVWCTLYWEARLEGTI